MNETGGVPEFPDNPNGALFLADATDRSIRSVLVASGSSYTVAVGPAAPTGVAYDPASGYLYVADQGNHRILRIFTGNGQTSILAGSVNGTGVPGFADGTGSAARFNNPTGVALDGNNNLYVADQGNHRIRVVR